jgi:4-amino-4-deoxy-L-arabinose transferase-like glycosyltransferase
LNSTRAVLAVIAAGTALRLVFGWAIGLGIDESYMVAAGRTLRLGYFDHPPIAWWLSAGAARLFGSDAPIVVRLPFIALASISSWLLFLLTRRMGSDRAGLWAVIAFTLAPVFGITSGGWVLPDGPLNCALLAFALCLIRALEHDSRDWWLAAGAAAGLAMLSKYSAALVITGAFVGLLILPEGRACLRRANPWLGALVAAILFAPVIAWNLKTGWASFAFQGGRAAAARFNPAGPFIVLAGSAAFVLPWIWAPALWAWARALRQHGPAFLLACMAAPPVILFAVVALWSRQVLFHWPAPGYLMMLPLLGMALARWDRPWLRQAAWGTAGLMVLGLAAVTLEVRTHALGLARDPALQAADWTALRPALAARGLLKNTLAAPNWSDMGKIDYALGGADIICLNVDARQYRFAPGPAAHIGEDILIIAPRQDATRIRAAYGNVFDAIEALPPLRVGLPGRPGTVFPIFLGRHLRVWPPADRSAA